MAESTADIKEYTSGKFKFLIDTDTGFFNATNMCKQQNKSYSRYTQLVRCKSIEQLLMSYYGGNYLPPYRATAKRGQEAAGMYCHPIIFLSVAMWCSSEVYVMAVQIVNEFFNSTQARRVKFYELFTIKRGSHINVKFNLAVDKNRWLGIVSLVQNDKRITNFKDLENKHDVTEVKGYLKELHNLSYSSSLSENGTKYYHPIIFLIMAALISDEFYVKASSIVLASLSGNDARLKRILKAQSEVESTSIALYAPIPLHGRVDVQPHNVIQTVIKSESVDENNDVVVNGASVETDNITSARNVIEPITVGFANHEVDIQPNIDATDVDVTDNDVAELQPTHSNTEPENTSSGGVCRNIGDVWGTDEFTNDSTSTLDVENKSYTESDIDRIKISHTIELEKLKREMDTQKRRLESQLREYQIASELEKKSIEEDTESRVQQIESIKQVEWKYHEKRLISEKEDIERKLKEWQLRFDEESKKQAEREKEAVENAKRLEQLNYTQKIGMVTRAASKEYETLRLKLQNEERDRNALEKEVEMLRLQIDEMRLGHSNVVTVPHKRKRVDCVLNMSDRQGLKKLESIIVILRSDGDICTFRRQLESIPSVLYKHKDEIKDFVCWFLTDNAVQDYNDIKKTLGDDLQGPITFEYNKIKTLNNSTEIVARTLYDHLKSMDTIEADVTVLRRFYEEGTRDVYAMPRLVDNYNEDNRVHVLLDQVYKIVISLYNDLIVKKNSKNKSK